MKKVLATLLILALCATLVTGVLVGCGNQETPDTTGGNETSSNDTTNDNAAGGEEQKTLTYEEYTAMSPAEQDAYRQSFADQSDFVEWYYDAYQTYEDSRDKIVLDPNNPVIDIGSLLG